MASYRFTPPEDSKRSDLRLIAPLPSGEKLIFGRQIPSNSKMIRYLTHLLKISHAIHSFRVTTREEDGLLYVRHLEALVKPKFDVARFLNMQTEELMPNTGYYNSRIVELNQLYNYTNTPKELRALLFNLRHNRRFFDGVTNKI